MPAVAAIAVIGAGVAIAKGVNASKAAKRAANAQQAGADQAAQMQEQAKGEALDVSEKATAQARADVQPYNAAGTEALGGLKTGLAGVDNLVTNPQAQKDYITNNPFFDALAKQSSTTLMNNQATKGKLGSGSTAEALQNSLLLLGSDLVNQNVTQRMNVNQQYQGLVNTGLSAAGTQASATNAGAGRDVSTITGVANNQSDLRLDSANAQAGGIIGAASARNTMFQGVANAATSAIGSYAGGAAGGALAGGGGAGSGVYQLSDMRAKENIEPVGRLSNGIPLYKFNYKGYKEIHINVMAQEAELYRPEAVTEIDGLKYVNMEQICQ